MTEPKTPMPELIRECQRKGGDTYRTRMVIFQVETRRAVMSMDGALNRLGDQFRRCAEVMGLLTKPHRKR